MTWAARRASLFVAALAASCGDSQEPLLDGMGSIELSGAVTQTAHAPAVTIPVFSLSPESNWYVITIGPPVGAEGIRTSLPITFPLEPANGTYAIVPGTYPAAGTVDTALVHVGGSGVRFDVGREFRAVSGTAEIDSVRGTLSIGRFDITARDSSGAQIRATGVFRSRGF